MANLTDLQNRLQTIAEAEKNGGILDIPTEAIQILAMCNSIRIEMINEMCEGLDPEQCDEQLFIQLVSNRRRLLIAFADAWNSCDASLIEYDFIDKYLEGN